MRSAARSCSPTGAAGCAPAHCRAAPAGPPTTLCRAQTSTRPSDDAANADPLTALLLRVDSEPVQDVQAGLPH
jgi:hypothetical protein